MKQLLKDAVYKEIGHYIGRDIFDLPADTRLDDLAIDYLDAVELTIQLEDSWDVHIPGNTEESFGTIQGTIDTLARLPCIQEKFII